MRSARPAARYCLTRFTPMPPGMKVKIASGCMEAIFASSDWKSSVVERNVGFLDDLALVVALEAGARPCRPDSSVPADRPSCSRGPARPCRTSWFWSFW